MADDNSVPDLAARYTLNQPWGHVAIAGLVRQLAYVDKQDGNNIDSDEISYGLSITSKINFGEDDLRVMANIGSGLGRYIGLNAVNSAVLNANNQLESIDAVLRLPIAISGPPSGAVPSATPCLALTTTLI